MGRSLGWAEGTLPVTESISGRLLRLPFFYEITEGQQSAVVELIDRFTQAASASREAGRIANA